MITQLARPIRIILLTGAILMTFATGAHATATSMSAADQTLQVTSGSTLQLTMRGASTYDAIVQVWPQVEPQHGELVPASEQVCTNVAGATHCTLDATYTPDAGYVGPDSFTYTAQATNDPTDIATATVMLEVRSPAPVFPIALGSTIVYGTTGSSAMLVMTVSSMRAGATADWGDGTGETAVTVNADGTATIAHAYMQPGSYVLTLSNNDPFGAVSTKRNVSVVINPPVKPVTPAPQVVQPSVVVQPQQTGSFGAPGLFVSVVAGDIVVSGSGMANLYQAGQFGYVPGPMLPPVILPANPGMQFNPPSAFNAGTTVGSGSMTITGGDPNASATVSAGYGAVDCVVRSKPRGAHAYAATGSATPKMYCNRRTLAEQEAAKGTPVGGTIELLYRAPNGKWLPVHSSTRAGAHAGVNRATHTVTVTLDSTSVPSIESLAHGMHYIIVTRPKPSAAYPIDAAAAGWPRHTTVKSGVVATCPKLAHRACVVRIVAHATHRHVRSVVGYRLLRVQPGRKVQLSFGLRNPGRWRLVSGRLNTTMSVFTMAPLARVQHNHLTFHLRVPLPAA